MNSPHREPVRPPQDVPYPWDVSPAAISPHTRSGMRTMDRTPRGGAAPNDPARIRLLIERGAALISELERAAWEAMPGGGAATALAFVNSSNIVTGERGIIVRRWLGGGVYSRPLAELLAPSGDVDESAREAANLLCGAAANGRLKIYAYREQGEASPRPAVFATIDYGDEPGRVRLLARLLVDSFEVEQWADPLAEGAGDGVN